ncbi:TIGR03943 family putative permease subunit [Microbacterium sp. Root166]|uniref:TIGR03943 family putative permease subunit n=1 Tax=Microbacterium sp. Root166 TaxID=1736478 RepID=UPI0009EC9CB7|nr:TIGR03943 family protein [Microbacterium sp. Root166]
MRSGRFIATRWLGVGLATVLAVVTISLAVTGRLGLYINPDSSWFAVSMAVLVLVGAVASFALPLGAEEDDGHDHDHDQSRHPVGFVATVAGGVVASGAVVLTLVLPPASLSAELAMARDVGAPPLFAGADVVTLAATGDTSSFGVGEWATVFATTTNPDAFDGDPITLTGFVTPGEGGDFDLTRLVITHCVIDAQPASIPVTGEPLPDTGQWVTVTGTVRANPDGRLEIDPDTVELIDEPQDPYEY